jgi:predicted RNA-binding Zn ribbon-like protein
MVTRRAAATPRALLRGPSDGLCLAFANTNSWRGTPTPTEELHGPADLLHWCEAAATLDPATLQRLRARWDRSPAEADAAFAEAIAIREAIFRIFAATAAGGAPAEADLAAFNAALRGAPERASLRRTAAATYLWEVPDPAPGLGLLLAPALWSAGDLLSGTRLAQVRQCANERCLWLFVDDSKSGNRRWCSMAACGNRAKAHRHYLRSRQPGSGRDR